MVEDNGFDDWGRQGGNNKAVLYAVYPFRTVFKTIR